jgi:hypothetical protein
MGDKAGNTHYKKCSLFARLQAVPDSTIKNSPLASVLKTHVEPYGRFEIVRSREAY